MSESKLWGLIKTALFTNRLLFIAITSSSEGAYTSEGWKFGEGKSNLAMAISKTIHQMFYNISDEEAEELVKDNMGYHLKDIRNCFIRGREKRICCWIQDDFQVIASKEMSHDKGLKKLAGILSAARPYVAVFISTQPELGDIARCMRELFMVELKIPERGLFEFQIIKSWTDFSDPLNPKKKMPRSEARVGKFPKISDELEKWYIKWRDARFTSEVEDWFSEYVKEEEEPIEAPPLTEVQRAAQIMVRAREAKKHR